MIEGSGNEMMLAELGTELNFAAQVCRLNEKLCDQVGDYDEKINELRLLMSTLIEEKRKIIALNSELTQYKEHHEMKVSELTRNNTVLEGRIKPLGEMVDRLGADNVKKRDSIKELQQSLEASKTIIANLKYQNELTKKNMQSRETYSEKLIAELKEAGKMIDMQKLDIQVVFPLSQFYLYNRPKMMKLVGLGVWLMMKLREKMP